MAFSIYNLIARLSVPLAVFGVFWLARKYFPALSKDSISSQDTMANLDERFSAINWIVYVSMICVGVILAWGMHSSLTTANELFADRAGPARFYLLPQTAIWWFLPGFSALTLSWEIVLFLWSMIAGREVNAAYRQWTNLKAGFDSTKILRILAVSVVLPIGVATVLAVPMHANLYNEEIRVRAYASSAEQVYRYADARSMTQIEGFRDRDGKLTRRAGIVIDFSDGRRWSSADYGNFKPTMDSALVSFLQQETHLPFGFEETESEIARP